MSAGELVDLIKNRPSLDELTAFLDKRIRTVSNNKTPTTSIDFLCIASSSIMLYTAYQQKD